MSNDDLIYRNRLVTMLNEQKQCEGFPDPWYEGYNTGLETAITISEHMPFVNAVPIKYGRWVKMTGMMPPEYHGHYCCSECQWHMKGLRNSWTREEELSYCPNCGTKMNLEECDVKQ